MNQLGHDARLISPQFVKPYAKGNKNDANDAEAICEVVGRLTMRFVPIKSIEQQEIQMLQRVRSGLVKERTALANRIRGLLAEYDIIVPIGIAKLRQQLPDIMENAESGLTMAARVIFSDLQGQLIEMDKQVGAYSDKIQAVHRASKVSQRLPKCPALASSPLPYCWRRSGMARPLLRHGKLPLG